MGNVCERLEEIRWVVHMISLPALLPTVMGVEDRVIIGRSHAPSVFFVGAPASRGTASAR